MADRVHPRTAEELGQRLYESTDAVGVPWGRRDRVIRESWVRAARRQIIADLAAAAERRRLDPRREVSFPAP